MSESKYIPELDKFHLVSTNSNNCFINIYVFILFIIIPFSEIYKIYFRKVSSYQKFIIKNLFPIEIILINLYFHMLSQGE